MQPGSPFRVALAMAEDAWTGRGPLTPDDGAPIEAPPRSRLGVILAAIVAAAASAGLAWWFAAAAPSPDLHAPPPPAPAARAEPIPPLRYAAADPDPIQVRRAWRDARQSYVDGGPDALVRASVSCAKNLPADPQLLDYCVAYDTYAAEMAPPQAPGGAGDWFAAAAERDLALARTALPGEVDPSNRIAQLSALTRAVIPKAAPARSQKVHAVRRAHVPAARPVKVRHVRKVVHARPKVLKASLPRPAHRARIAAHRPGKSHVARPAAIPYPYDPGPAWPVDPPH